MKNKFLLTSLGAAVLAMAIYSCQDPGAGVSPAKTSQEVTKPTKFVGVPNSVAAGARLDSCKNLKDITYSLKDGELNWVKDTVYCLCGDIRVAASKTLHIAAGTLVRGVKAAAGSLTVLPGAQIDATGLASDPIIFTSSETVNNRAPMDWGGVILLGNARVNQTPLPLIEGFPAAGTTPHGVRAGAPSYGGLTDALNTESSGTFKFVRIEFGGVPLPGVANSEKNGLTLGGVGSGTTIDHVQVSFGGDDGFEWFGGTVNSKYLISHRNLDDDFDTDFGYSGKMQFGLISRDPAKADISNSNGFESDNDGTGSTNLPRTSGIFSNVTVVGPIQCPSTVFSSLFQDGAHLRRRTELKIYNTVITGFRRSQVFVADANVNPTLGSDLAVAPNGFGLIVEPATNFWTTGTNNSASTASTACSDVTTDLTNIYRLSGLQPSAWNLTGVNFTPFGNSIALGYTSPLLATGTNANLIDAFFTANTTTTSGAGLNTFFKGARRASDDNGWSLSSGWVNYQPESLAYPNDGQY